MNKNNTAFCPVDETVSAVASNTGASSATAITAVPRQTLAEILKDAVSMDTFEPDLRGQDGVSKATLVRYLQSEYEF